MQDVVLFVLDADTRRTLFVSDAYERLFGRPLAPLFADPDAWLEAVHPDDRPSVVRTGMPSAPGDVREARFRIVRPDGSVRRVQSHLVHKGAVGGRGPEIVGITVDVERRVVAEENLREAENRLREITTTARDAFWVVGLRDGRLLYTTPAFETIFGRPISEAFANPAAWAEWIHPDDRERALDAPKALAAGQDSYAVEYRIVRPDGSTRWVRDRAQVIRGPDGVATKLAGVSEDFTQRRAMEEELRAAKARLEELDAFRTQFVNNAVHELKNPLTPIALQLYMLRRADLPPQARQAVEVLDRNFARFEGLILDFLDAARLQAGRLAIAPQPTDVRRVLEDAVAAYIPIAAQADVRIALHAPEGLEAQVDAKRLQQVVANLLANAVKFTPRDGSVRVTAARDTDALRIDVEDTGVGMTPEQMRALFEPYAQVHPEHASKGIGLGLYISRGIVEAHGGTLAVASDGPGRGTTFRLTLPATS